jgi:hypothetical protein
MLDLRWDKVALGRFSPSTSVSPAIVVRSTNYSTITLIYHPVKMYNRPMCGRSTGTYTNLGDLQRDLMGVKSHSTKKNTIQDSSAGLATGYVLDGRGSVPRRGKRLFSIPRSSDRLWSPPNLLSNG